MIHDRNNFPGPISGLPDARLALGRGGKYHT